MSQLLYTRGNQSHWGSSWSGCLNSFLVLLWSINTQREGRKMGSTGREARNHTVCCRSPAKTQGQQLTTSCFSNMPRLHLQRDQT